MAGCGVAGCGSCWWRAGHGLAAGVHRRGSLAAVGLVCVRRRLEAWPPLLTDCRHPAVAAAAVAHRPAPPPRATPPPLRAEARGSQGLWPVCGGGPEGGPVCDRVPGRGAGGGGVPPPVSGQLCPLAVAGRRCSALAVAAARCLVLAGALPNPLSFPPPPCSKEYFIETGQRHYYFMNVGNGEVIDASRRVRPNSAAVAVEAAAAAAWLCRGSRRDGWRDVRRAAGCGAVGGGSCARLAPILRC